MSGTIIRLMSTDGSWVEADKVHVEITNHLTNAYGGVVTTHTLRPYDVASSFEATVEVDNDTYEHLAGWGPLFTVQVTYDSNPWHYPSSLWKRLWWTFERYVLRRVLDGVITVTIPKCRMEGPASE